MLRTRTVAVAGAALLAFAAAPAAAAPTPQPYGTNGFAGFRDVLPPGTNGLVNGVQLAQYEGDHSARPPHNDDQRDMYANLVYGAPNVGMDDLSKYYKDGTFGVRPDDVASTTSPRDDVTIVRDKQFGIPHVYGSTRAGAEFGLGYAAAQDRLFFIDILRHLGRAQLTAFAGGAPGNQAFDQSQWSIAPYNESDLQRQFDLGEQVYGSDGAQLQQDSLNYVAGINEYINEAKLNPLMMPGEYAAIGKPLGPDPWKTTDLIAAASLIGGIFGRGGGAELDWGELLQGFQKKFGAARGRQMWLQLRAVDDSAAPTTVHNGRRFPYRVMPRKVAHRKHQRGRMRGETKGGSQITFGEYGIQALEPGWITARQIEAARIAMTRHVKRGGKVWITIFPDKPVTEKPAETRMGSGKGNPERWVAPVRPGRIMFELSGVPEPLAKEAMERAIQKLPIKAKFVTRAGESL